MMYKRVDKLCLTDKVVMLGVEWAIHGIRRQALDHKKDDVQLGLYDPKRRLFQEFGVTTWQEIEVKE